MSDIQPLERHPADVDSLEQCGADLLSSVEESIANGETIDQAYQPAIDHWDDGMCSPEVEAAPLPLGQDTMETRAALAWAAIVTRYWASRVRKFNERVDEIRTELDGQAPNYGAVSVIPGMPPTSAEIDVARLEATDSANRRWHSAHYLYIELGGERAATMLEEGPTEDNLLRAARVGALDTGDPSLLDSITGGLWSQIRYGGAGPLAELGPLGPALWAWGRFGSTRSNALNAFLYFRYGRDFSRLSLWGVLSGRWSPFHVPRHLPSASTTSRFARFSRWGGRLSTVVRYGVPGLQQYLADSGRTDLTNSQRVARVGYRTVVVGAATGYGASVGTSIGALGFALGPVGFVTTPLGTVVGGAVGAWVGDKFVDWTIEPVTDAVGWLDDRVRDTPGWMQDRWNDTRDVREDVGGAAQDSWNSTRDVREDVGGAAQDGWNSTRDVREDIGGAVTSLGGLL